MVCIPFLELFKELEEAYGLQAALQSTGGLVVLGLLALVVLSKLGLVSRKKLSDVVEGLALLRLKESTGDSDNEDEDPKDK